VSYGRELRIRADIRRKRKVKKAMEFAEKMKRVQIEAETMLKKA